jgi:hypothetical protein
MGVSKENIVKAAIQEITGISNAEFARLDIARKLHYLESTISSISTRLAKYNSNPHITRVMMQTLGGLRSKKAEIMRVKSS